MLHRLARSEQSRLFGLEHENTMSEDDIVSFRLNLEGQDNTAIIQPFPRHCENNCSLKAARGNGWRKHALQMQDTIPRKISTKGK